MIGFPKTKNHQEFEEKFLSMVVHGKKSTTYKFAFAKFLLEYCNQKTVEEHVEFSTIAKTVCQVSEGNSNPTLTFSISWVPKNTI